MADRLSPIESGAVHQPIPHDSAKGHVSGAALYIDDLPEPPGLLHLAFGLSSEAHAGITAMDLSAVERAPGVVAVYTAADILGDNDVSPVAHDDRLLAEGEVLFFGQPIFLVAATSAGAARKAARLGRIDYEPRPALLTIAEARAAGSLIEASQVMSRGDAASALAASPRRLAGEVVMGGQDHFYLEGQIALATPGEAGTVHVHSSTQHPSEVQHLIARMLKRPHADVTVEVRRMGGGFGGKETQAALFACAAALVATRTGRPAKFRVDRDVDMTITGKRHDFEIRYDVGFDQDGRIVAAIFDLASRCGATTDLSPAINDRAMFHVDNCYYIPDIEIRSHRFRTHTVSNTAFRGFGGPQGMMAIEQVIDAIAADIGRDPIDVRRANFYAPGRDLTPYHMKVEDNVAPQLVDELAETARYLERVEGIERFNQRHRTLKRGIALTPVKFGISFTTTHLNQAGALLLVYSDGSIHLNHGGTEMGQGLMIKVAQIVADVFAVPIEDVRVNATSTAKVPNTSATAASSGADLNGMAAYNAAVTVRDRLAAFAATRFGGDPGGVAFTRDGVEVAGQTIDFPSLCRMAQMGRISLSSTGFYSTPEIHYDRATHQGRPFYYFAYGAAVSEVVIDTLSGEHKVLRVDILHDAGNSLNPAIDLGQIEGGFVQGMGWLTTEDLVFDKGGRLLTHAPSTYKIPCAADRPREMNISIWPAGRSAVPTIHRSKAVGEPPFMLAISVFSALTRAVASVSPGKGMPKLRAPATPEQILAAVTEMRARA